MHVVRSVLRVLYAGWMRFAFVLGTINRYVLLTLFYFLIVNIVNVFLRLFRIDLLDRRMRPRPSYWHAKPAEMKQYTHQF